MKLAFSKLDGYKTYLVCITTVAYALAYYGLNLHQWGNAVDLILGSSGLGALRHGVAKVK